MSRARRSRGHGVRLVALTAGLWMTSAIAHAARPVEAGSAQPETPETPTDAEAGQAGTLGEAPPGGGGAPASNPSPAAEPAKSGDETPSPDTDAASLPSGGYTVTPPEVGPPFYDGEDEAALTERFDLPSAEVQGPEMGRGKRAFRCLIADPNCGWNLEVQATSAYALRVRQGNVNRDELARWNSGHVQYDLWVNFPVSSEVVGDRRYTRVTLGPKGGVSASDSQSLWGNVGVAMRYWLGRGSWAPTLEVSSGLNFWLRGERGNFGVGTQRSPLGLVGDIGVGVGGWGAIVVGGQVDTPLARDELPDQVRISAGGTFFVGFRGNIAWGLPAVAAVGTHAAVQRTVTAP